MAEALAKQGKPHYVEIQGAQYEGSPSGSTRWSPARAVASSTRRPAASPRPACRRALDHAHLATSPAADPSLSDQMEDQNRLAMESGTAAFELNYPFVYPSMKANKPAIVQDFPWAPYPGVDANRPARPTIGGIDLAVGAFSTHQPLAFEPALCLRNRENQMTAAVKGGLPPTLAGLYGDPG